MNNKKGFTLIELLLVIMIIGFMLAVILPRGLRATTDSKYNLVRQNCSELAAYGNDWIEQQILAQDASSTATRADYLDTMVSRNGNVAPAQSAAWIADRSDSNWNKTANNGLINVPGRRMNGVNDSDPENSVEEIIEPGKVLRNPFNGGSIFLRGPNFPRTRIIPGAIACAYAFDSSTGGTFNYYSFVFQGTDSTAFGGNPRAAGVYNNGFHGGMGTRRNNLAGVRQGVFFTKVRQ